MKIVPVPVLDLREDLFLSCTRAWDCEKAGCPHVSPQCYVADPRDETTTIEHIEAQIASESETSKKRILF